MNEERETIEAFITKTPSAELLVAMFTMVREADDEKR